MTTAHPSTLPAAPSRPTGCWLRCIEVLDRGGLESCSCGCCGVVQPAHARLRGGTRAWPAH